MLPNKSKKSNSQAAKNGSLPGSQLLAGLVAGGNELLVLESNGFTLCGAVARLDKKQVTFEAVAVSRAPDPASAVGKVCIQLKKKLGHLPKKAVMIAPGVVSALLDLPVEPDKPRPREQMQELLRWEVDPYFSEYNELWNIGAILQGRGYLTAEQRHEVAVELEIRQSSGSVDLTRYGETAMNLMGVKRENLDECLEIQERMVSQEVTLACGWSLQQWGTDDEDEAQSAWYVCGAAESRRKVWVNALARSKVKLEWFYPATGSLARLLPEAEEEDAEQVLLELHQEQLACLRLVNGSLASLQMVQRPNSPDQLTGVCQDLCAEQMRPGVSTIYVYSADPVPEDLLRALADGLERRVEKLKVDIGLDGSKLKVPVDELFPLFGLATQALLTKKQSGPSSVRVESRNPPPPVWKNVEVLRYALPGLVIAGIAGHAAWSQYRMYEVKQEQVSIEGTRAKTAMIAQVAQSLSGQATSLIDQINAKEVELKQINKRLRLLDGTLVGRKTEVPKFLRNIAASINAYVVVDKITESTNPPGFLVSGWAIRDHSAQKFAKRLSNVMSAQGYMVAETKLYAANGRTGVRGYGVNVWLIPIPENQKKELQNKNSKSVGDEVVANG